MKKLILITLFLLVVTAVHFALRYSATQHYASGYNQGAHDQDSIRNMAEGWDEGWDIPRGEIQRFTGQ